MGLKMSKDKRYLLVSGASKTQSKVWVLGLNDKAGKVKKVWEGSGKLYINHIEGYFLLWSLHSTSQVRLISDASVNALSKNKDTIDLSKLPGEVLYTSLEDEMVEDIDLLRENVVLYGQKVTSPFIKVIQYQPKGNSFDISVKDVPMPYPYGSVSPCTNEDYHSHSILFSVSNPFVYD